MVEKIKVPVPRTEPSELPGIIRGSFDHNKVRALLRDIYGAEKYQDMIDAGVDQRMPFGTNEHYHALAMGMELKGENGEVLVPEMPPSKEIAALILPRLNETEDMSGEKDPSNQLAFSPSAEEYSGLLLHKYPEIVLGFVSPVCSAHCRYCYRLDLFSAESEKQRIQPEKLRDYIIDYNAEVDASEGNDADNGDKQYPVRELLLSGGDVLTLTNALIARYAEAGGQAGVEVLRFGTKEIAFRPERVDDAFIETLETVHAEHPNMKMNFVVHFTHPDEFLLRDAEGSYVPNDDGTGLKWMDESFQAVKKLADLPFVTMENQSPIISYVNDDVEALHTLHAELNRMSIKPKYMFQGREIEGHAAFSLPVEETWQIHNEAMKGLSDGARSRLVMSTEWGKMEVVSVVDGYETGNDDQALHSRFQEASMQEALGDGFVIFKLYRAADMDQQGDVILAKRNPEALWTSGYEDRILYDARDPDKYRGLRVQLTKADDEFRGEKPHVVNIPEHLMRNAVLLDLQDDPEGEGSKLIMLPPSA